MKQDDGGQALAQDGDDLRSAERALKVSEVRLERLIESVQVGVVLQSADGKIVFANEAAAALFGMTVKEMEGRTAGDPMWSMIDESGNPIPDSEQPFPITIRTGKPVRGALRGLFPEDPGRTRWVLVNTEPFLDQATSSVSEVVVTFQDITGRRRVEDALRDSEAMFRGVFLDSPTGINLVDRAGKIVAVNPRFCEMLGYSEEEILGKDPDQFTHPYDLELSPRQSRALDTAVGSGVEVEKRYLRKDGGAVWCTLRTSQILGEDGEPKYELGLVQDISPRRKAEAELRESEARLRALSTRLASVRETERAAVSRELHDELGQALTSLRMDLSMIHSWLIAGKEIDDLVDRVAELLANADTNIDLVRTISSRLRPPILDVMGVGPAIEWQVEEHRTRASAEFHLDITLESGAVSKGNATSIFRIAQEAMTNVLRHARAENVWVHLNKIGRWIELVVEDDGDGIREGASTSHTALGLLGMRERALSMGGKLTIGDRRGGGTVVRLRVPAGAGRGGGEE